MVFFSHEQQFLSRFQQVLKADDKGILFSEEVTLQGLHKL